MYKVRFHLQSGENFKKWQVRGPDSAVRYLDPKQYSLEMLECKLVNKINRAKKVHAEGVKDVAGWIECAELIVTENIPVDNLERLFYNPIVDPHWRRDSDDGEFVWDNYCFSSLVTNSNKVYVLEERS
jgi:hypothetical protein